MSETVHQASQAANGTMALCGAAIPTLKDAGAPVTCRLCLASMQASREQAAIKAARKAGVDSRLVADAIHELATERDTLRGFLYGLLVFDDDGDWTSSEWCSLVAHIKREVFPQWPRKDGTKRASL